ncbi:MAG TPA: sigma-70 family RNA polymerase sigma factor [Candidatus Limnocylindrales bacterium]
MTPFSHDEGTALRELVRRARAGDGDAFGDLYDRYAPRIYRFALVRLGSPEAAEDLLQEVFLKVVEALPRYEERGTPFAAWLFRIARNGVIDHVRARAGTVAEPLDAALAVRDDAPGPADLAELKGDAALLVAALDTLTPEQRDVVVYRFFAGLSPAEIAGVMDRREGTIRALQFRALGALRRHLDRVEADSHGRDPDGRDPDGRDPARTVEP